MSWLDAMRQTPPLYFGFLALAGAIAGSFASAAIWRIPREGMTIWKPARSHCPKCGAIIRWHDNFPLLGWVVLGGRCRDCKVSFGPGYLVHEVVLALLFVLAGRTWSADPTQGGGPGALVLVLVALTALWIAAAIDWQHFILPESITIGGVVFGFAASALVPAFHLWPGLEGRLPWGIGWLGFDGNEPAVQQALASAALGALISFGFLFGIGKLFSYLLGQDALGFGDVKYLAAVGALLGLEGALWTLLVGVFAGALFGIANVSRMILAVRRRRRARASNRVYAHSARHVGWAVGRVIPFGPPLILGTTLLLLDPASVHRFFFETWPGLLVR